MTLSILGDYEHLDELLDEIYEQTGRTKQSYLVDGAGWQLDGDWTVVN